MPPTHFCLSARNLGWYVYRSFLPFVALTNYLSAGSIHPVVIVPGLSASALENTETGERKWVNEFEILGKLLYLSPPSFSHFLPSLYNLQISSHHRPSLYMLLLLYRPARNPLIVLIQILELSLLTSLLDGSYKKELATKWLSGPGVLESAKSILNFPLACQEKKKKEERRGKKKMVILS